MAAGHSNSCAGVGKRSPVRKRREQRSSAPRRATVAAADDKYRLRLYVAGQTAKSIRAFANLKQFCEKHLAGKYSIGVIDLLEKPQLARGDQIVAIPTLVRKLPLPIRKIIGDLPDESGALVGLDMQKL